MKSLKTVASPLVYKAKQKELFAAAEKYAGIFPHIATAVGISVQQLQRYYKDYPEFKEIVDNAREAFYHKAVAKLEEMIEDGNIQALNLYFSRSPWAKRNGWSEKVETDQTVKLSDSEKAQKAREILGIE